MQARADKSSRANPRAQGCGRPGRDEWGQRPPPPSKDAVVPESQSPGRAACESGLEGNAATIHELTFCYYSVPGLACSWPARAPGGTAAGVERRRSRAPKPQPRGLRGGTGGWPL